MRGMGKAIASAAIAIALLAPVSEAAAATAKRLPGGDGVEGVAIRRTAHGIPHIIARSFRDLGYGYAYAFAQDNVCTIAREYVTIRAERSRFFGANASWRFEGNGTTVNNLNSDFFFKRIIDTKLVERLRDQKLPHGPRPEVKQAVAGYVDGYNRYLRETGVGRLPDATCRGKEWVRPITEIDVYRYFYLVAQLASGGVAIDGIGSAAPPTPALTAEPNTPSVAAQKQLILGNLDRFKLGDLGSNGYGLGKEATQTGHGMVLGNPHFPWQGAQRFYQSHLTIPGKLDVAGASLFGVPVVLIGHTQKLAWTHTVSTARRFTPFQLTLVPGSPTQYLYDGQVRTMKADKVTVQVPGPGGALRPMTRTLYSTHQGPVMTSLLNLPLFPWTPVLAWALGDANASNFRYLNHFLETDMAQSVRQLDRVERKYQGIPWVNTIAADSRGEAYYADIGAIPNVSNTKTAGCNTVLGQATLPLLGVAILDGSRSACAWDNDPAAVAPGIFGPDKEPSLFRNDYVTNSNDSYWLSNPKQPLEGFARIIGDERVTRSLRTRLGLKMVEQRLNGSDGKQGKGFTRQQLQDTVFNNRQYAGELFRDSLVSICRSSPLMLGTAGLVNVSAACPVLESWGLTDDLDDPGAVLFRRFAAKALPLPGPLSAVPASNPLAFSTGFDVNDPVNTPRGLSPLPTTQLALADAVAELRASGIPLAAKLRDYQYEFRGSEKIPIHGGPGTLGVFNAISNPFVRGKGFPDVGSGSSFVMAADMNGTACPDSRSILTYSQSANPSSPYYADQTKLYSQKKWVDMRFCTSEILRDAKLRATEIGCLANSAFRRASLRGGSSLRFAFVRRYGVGVDAGVFSTGGRLIKGFARRSKAFSWSGAKRLADGWYIARVGALGRTGRVDLREFAFRVSDGRVLVSKRGYALRERCALLRRATLGSPVLRASPKVRVTLAARAKVSVTVSRGGRVVRRVNARTLKAGTRRVALGALGRGTYRVTVVARRGKQRSTATLAARR